MAQNVEIIITALDRASGQIKQVRQSLDSLGKTSGFVGETLKFFAQAQVFGGLMALQTGLAGAVVEGIQFNSSMELALMRWTALTGSASKGQGMVDMILRVAKETSFTTDQINNYATQLAGAGVKSEDLEGKLMGLANVTARYGLTSDQAKNAVRGYVQAIGKGKISVEELNQMQENGIPIYQILQEELGLTSEQIQGAGKDADTSRKIIKFLNDEFLDGRESIEAYGKTFAGRLDKMKDSFTVFAGVVTKPVFTKLSEGMDTATKFMETFQSSIEKGKGAVQAFRDAMSSDAWQTFSNVMGVIAGLAVWQVLKSAVPKVQTLYNAFKKLGSGVRFIGVAFSGLGLGIMAIAGIIGILVSSFMDAYDKSSKLRSQVGQLRDIMEIAWGVVKEFGGALGDIVVKFLDVEDSTRAWEKAMDSIIPIAKGLAIALAVMGDVVLFFINLLAGLAKGVWSALLAFEAFRVWITGDWEKAGKIMDKSMKAGADSLDFLEDAITGFTPENSLAIKTERALERVGKASEKAKTDFGADMLQMKNDTLNTGASMSAKASATGTAISNGLKKGSVGAQILSDKLKASSGSVKVSLDSMSAKSRASATAISTALSKGGVGAKLLQDRIMQSKNSSNASMGAMSSKASTSGSSISNGLKKGSAGAKFLQDAINKTKSGSTSDMNSIIKKASDTSSSLSKSGKSGGSGFSSGISNGSSKASSSLSKSVSSMVSSANKGASGLSSAGKKGGTGLSNGVRMGSANIPSIVLTVMSRAKNYITGTSWYGAGQSLLKTFANGISSASSWVASAVSKAVAGARKFLPGSDAKKGALSDLTHSGYMLPVTFSQGISKGASVAVREAQRLTSQVDRSLQSEVGARMFASGNSVTVYHRHDGTVNVNGSGIGQVDQFVSGSIGYTVDSSGVKQAIRQRTGGR